MARPSHFGEMGGRGDGGATEELFGCIQGLEGKGETNLGCGV